MSKIPLQFITIQCRHCSAIVALMPPGCVVYTTHLRCVHCGEQRTIYAADSKQPESSAPLTVANA